MKFLLLSLMGALTISSVGLAQTVPEKTVGKLAAQLAAALANKSAKDNYRSEPFAGDNSEATLSDGRWHWQSVKGYGKGDLRADVSFLPDGSDQKVKVSILTTESSQPSFSTDRKMEQQPGTVKDAP